ncbi:MAG: glycosyltransferase [Ardenticatenaceae bacterium]
MPKQKILFHTGSLAGGGAQRVIVTLLRELDRTRFEGYLVLREREGVYFDLVPPDIPIIAFPNGTLSRRKNITQLGQIISELQPHLVISFLDGANVLALETKLLKRPRCSFIISQRNNLSISLQRNYPYSAWRRWLKRQQFRWLYRKADHIISLSQGVKVDLVNKFKLPDRMITPIHNPIDLELVEERSQAQVDYPWSRGEQYVILGVGRLIEQKGFSDLINAFAKVRTSDTLSLPKGRPSKLLILGEGVLREQLESLVASLNLQEHVYMPGFVDNPWAYMRDADLFVLSSHWEGLGNVVIEAMACGTPVIATDCDFGPGEIIQHGENGILVPVGDYERLGEAIGNLLNDSVERDRLAQAGRRRALDFESGKICRQYESIFDEYTG